MKSYSVRVVGLIGTPITVCVRIGTIITINKITYTNLGSDLRLEADTLSPPRIPE